MGPGEAVSNAVVGGDYDNGIDGEEVDFDGNECFEGSPRSHARESASGSDGVSWTAEDTTSPVLAQRPFSTQFLSSSLGGAFSSSGVGAEVSQSPVSRSLEDQRARVSTPRPIGGSNFVPSIASRSAPPDDSRSMLSMSAGTRKQRLAISGVVAQLLSNLGIVADLRVGERLHFTATGDFEIQAPSMYTTAHRTITGANRRQTFDQVSSLISTAEWMVDEGSITDPRIMEALVHSVHGLRNLQKTYGDDRTFRNRIDVLLKRIEIRYGLDENLVV